MNELILNRKQIEKEKNSNKYFNLLFIIAVIYKPWMKGPMNMKLCRCLLDVSFVLLYKYKIPLST